MMRTDGAGKVIKVPSCETQENIKNTRKTLKVLQQAATDKENLVGRIQRSGKDLTTKLSNSENSNVLETKNKVKLSNKSTQTGNGTTVDVNDLTTEGEVSENYWRILAEKRREALDESLEENRKLVAENAALKEENRIVKTMLDESKSLVEVLTEMLGESDTSTTEADVTVETAEEATEEK